MDSEPKFSKPLSYKQVTRVIVIFLAIALGILYARNCSVNNDLVTLREVVELQQNEIDLLNFTQEAQYKRTKDGFRVVGHALSDHKKAIKSQANILGEIVLILDEYEKLGEELIASLEEVYHNTALAFPKVIEEARPGVVGIMWHEYEPTKYTGTGALINCWEGYVLTAKHVVEHEGDDPNNYYVVMHGEKVGISEIFLDPNEDLAVLILDITDPNYAPSMFLPLADPNSSVAGQLVLAMGFPYGRDFSK
jgi:S1-C subfamily serine protease